MDDEERGGANEKVEIKKTAQKSGLFYLKMVGL